MKRTLFLLVAAALLLAGCSSAAGTSSPKPNAPVATTPVTSHDFGDVPVTEDMSRAQKKTFVIQNDGGADLKLSNLRVKLLEGC